MFKTNLKTFITIGVVTSIFTLTGCAVTGQKIQKTVNLSSKKPKELVFPKTDPVTDKKITKDDISKLNYAYQIKKLSFYSHNRIKYNTLRVSKHTDNYEIGYYYQACCPASVVFKMPYKIEDNKLIFYYPKNYIYKGEKAPVTGIQTYPFNGIKNVINDFNNFIYPRLDKMTLYTNTYLLKGEIDSPYKADSVKANFDRKLKKYSDVYSKRVRLYGNSKYNYDDLRTNKNEVYAIKIGKYNYPAWIKVYPYHNGSKIEYTVIMPYEVYSYGKSTLTKEDVQKTKNLIESIAKE